MNRSSNIDTHHSGTLENCNRGGEGIVQTSTRNAYITPVSMAIEGVQSAQGLGIVLLKGSILGPLENCDRGGEGIVETRFEK